MTALLQPCFETTARGEMRWLKVDASKWRKNDEIDGRHSSSTSSLKWWSEWTTAGRWGAGVENNVRGQWWDTSITAQLWFCWSVLIALFFNILMTEWRDKKRQRGPKWTKNQRRRKRREKEEVKEAITTPWPPGSPDLHPSPRWPPCPPCSSYSSCVCAFDGCHPPRCRASVDCCC